jgi:uncharacterized membrane protein
MTASDAAHGLGRDIARVLRVGTLLAVACIAIGYAIELASGDSGPGPIGVLALLGHGGGDAILAVGLLALTLTPLVAVTVAAVDLARAGERVRAATALGVAVLLVIALAVAAIIGGSS